MNEPSAPGPLGRGQGFGTLQIRPRFEEQRPKPRKLRDAWFYTSWLIVSPHFAAIFREFDPGLRQFYFCDPVSPMRIESWAKHGP